jgi:hypothetical protein
MQLSLVLSLVLSLPLVTVTAVVPVILRCRSRRSSAPSPR